MLILPVRDSRWTSTNGEYELLIGNWSEVYVFLNHSIRSEPILNHSNANYVLEGNPLWMAGSSVSSAGDWDGDGLDDILIGDPIANFAWDSYDLRWCCTCAWIDLGFRVRYRSLC